MDINSILLAAAVLLALCALGCLSNLWFLNVERQLRYRPGVPVAPISARNATLPSLQAKQLFLKSLTPAQLKQWRDLQRILVRGSDGQNYWLYTALAADTYNVKCEASAFCAYPNHLGLPLYDRFLAQKLLLETNAHLYTTIAHSIHTIW